MKKSLFLVTNDDGVSADGIHALAESISLIGEVVVVAPDRERSAAGHSLTLVVTGKGGAAPHEPAWQERGVLRRLVPHWLRLPALRALVLGFEEAGLRHGGAGALYVRLRRSRGAG